MNIIAFDPGHTTGWALLSGGEIEAGSFSMWADVWEIIGGYTSAPPRLEAIIIEAFVLRRGKALALSGSKLETVQVIGYIKAVCDHFGIKYVEQQPACKAIRVAKIEGLNVHAMDAVRHGLYYMKKHGEAKPYREFLTR